VAQAVLMPSGEWRLFGQGEIREDEVITHWIEPELPEGYPAGADNQDLADSMATRNFPPTDASNVVVGESPFATATPPPADDATPPPLVNELVPPPPLKNELES
jgi:hypothetical protein